MAYHIQNYWVFGLFPSSGILGTRKHDVSETGSVSVLRCCGEDTYSVESRKVYSYNGIDSLCFSYTIIAMMKLRRNRRAIHVERMGEVRNG
jgi:hypothetical protein